MGPLERQLIARYQRGLPLVPEPYAVMARRFEVTESAVIAALKRLRQDGVISRVGAVVRPNTAGASTLAAMSVPAPRLEAVAAIVSAQAEVNHNYARDHALNLWFVVTGEDAAHVAGVLQRIERLTGIAPVDLPLEAEYHIDLGFAVRC